MHRQTRKQRLLPVVSHDHDDQSALSGDEGLAPVNDWDDGPAGAYFRDKKSLNRPASHEADHRGGGGFDDGENTLPSLRMASTKSSPHKHGADHSQLAAPTADRRAKMTYRAHLQERQAVLDEFIASRVQLSLESQRYDEEVRLEACKRQRQAEQLKLLQMTRGRIELQMAAKQPVKVEHAARFNIDPNGLANEAKQAAEDRWLHRERCMQAFYASGAERMAVAMEHREKCRHAEFEKARARVALEEYVGTAFSTRRRKLWTTAGVDVDAASTLAGGNSATTIGDLAKELTLRSPQSGVELAETPAQAIMFRCPTAEEMHRTSHAQSRQRDLSAGEKTEISRYLQELTSFNKNLKKAQPHSAAANPNSAAVRPQPLQLSINAPLPLSSSHRRSVAEK